MNLVKPGFCQCGCGEKTLIAKQTITEKGWVRGEPRPYVGQHAKRHRTYFRDGDVGYVGAHYRARKVLGIGPCSHADDTCKGPIQIAYKHDAPEEFVRLDPRGCPYSLRPEDYTHLCASHHVRYDIQQRRLAA